MHTPNIYYLYTKTLVNYCLKFFKRVEALAYWTSKKVNSKINFMAIQ